MQHALLGLAIALIVAIVAALAAPAFVDWNDWRATFESRTTALVGAPVRIRGPIEATILPTPAFVLGDVEIGDPESATGIRAGEVRGILSLGALLRGVVEAEEFVLKRPALRLAIERDGRLVLPAMAAEPADADSFSISRITLEGGSLIVEDRATQGLLIIDQVSAAGELRSRAGPLRFEASLRQNGRRWTLRANTGRFGGDDASRLRLLIERADDGTLIDADGTLALAKAEPRFEGRIMLARRGGNGLPWRITADAKANGERVTLDSLVLALGAGEAPIELGGNVQFTPRPRGRIDGTLIARRLDLDRAAGIKNAQGFISVLAWAREALALIDGLPFAGRIGLAVESVAVGGNQVRDLSASLGVRDGALALERIEARLPGRGSIKAASSGAGSAIFSGDVMLEAEDAAAFAHWFMGGTKSASIEESQPLRLGGRVELAPGRVTIDKLDFALGDAKLGGRLVLVEGEGTRRTRIETDLNADGIDLDLLAPMAAAAIAGSDALDLQLGFKGRGLRVLGRPLRGIDAALARTAEGVAVERLLIDDLDGLSAKASGRIGTSWERANGRIEFEVAAARAEGLAVVAQALGGEDAAALTLRIAAGKPLKLTGAATGGGSVAGIAIEAEGRLAEFGVRFGARIDPRMESFEEARVVLEAQESGGLVAMLGLTPAPPVPGEGRLELAALKPRAGALPVTLQLQVPGASLTGEGEIRSLAGGRIEPRLNLRLEAADLRPLLAAPALAGGGDAAPVSVSARLTRAGDGIAFENIAANIGDQRAHGRILVDGLERPKFSGKLEIARVGLASVLGLALGRAGEGSSFWSEARLGTPLLAGATGTVEFAVGALELLGPITATDAEFKLRLGENDAAIEDFAADLAGGKLGGQARFVRGDALAIDGRIALGQFEVARLIAPASWQSIARGRGNLALSFAGSGRTPAALAANLAGQGTLALEAVEIDDLDPGALAQVLAATASAEPPDEAGVLALLATALAKGPLRLAKLEAPVIVAAGVARSGKARSQAGAVAVAAEGSLDLARLSFEAAIELEGSAPAGVSAKAGAVVRWRGLLGAPERGIEAAALATAITMRAMERDAGKLEAPERPPARAPRSAETPTPAPPAAALPKRVPLPPPRPRDPGASFSIMAPPLPPRR